MPRTDPRLADIPDSINDAVAARAIRHALFLEGLKTREVNQILNLLSEDVIPDLLDQIESRLRRIGERGFDLGPVTTRRLQDLTSSLDTVVREGNAQIRSRLTDDLHEIAQAEAEFQAGVLSTIADIEVDLPSVSLLRSVVTARPFQGSLLSKHFQTLTAAQQGTLQREIRIGIGEGQSIPQIMRRIRGTRAARFTDGVLNVGARQAEAIVRTAVNHTSTHAREAVFEANSDQLRGVQWVSTLDSRLCAECMALDGQIFPVGTGRRPPAHHNCRCTTTPVLKGEKAARTQTAEQWLRGQPRSVQEMVLDGKAKAEFFSTGKLNGQQFVNRASGKPLSLAQIKINEADVLGIKLVDPTAGATVFRQLSTSNMKDEFNSLSNNMKVNITKLESDAALAYNEGQDLFVDVNKTLRAGNIPADRLSEVPGSDKVFSAAELDSAISKSKLPEDLVLYRGFKYDPKTFGGLDSMVGTEIVDSGFISTTASERTAQSFARGDLRKDQRRAILQIETPKGTEALNFHSIEESVITSLEQEILLGRGSKFRVKDFIDNGASVIQSNGTEVSIDRIILEIVDG